MTYVQKMARIPPIRIDVASLEDENVGIDSPITFHAHQATVGEVMTLMLQPLALAWVRRGDTLEVMTQTQKSGLLSTRRHDVSDLIKPFEKHRNPRGKRREPHELLTDFIQEATRAWITTDESEKFLRRTGDTLVLRHDLDTQDEVSGVLKTLRLYLDGRFRRGAVEIHPSWCPAEDQAAVEAALDRIVDRVNLEDVPLRDALDSLVHPLCARTLLDRLAFEGENIPIDSPVSLQAESITLREALERLLEPLGASAIPQYGFLIITTLTEAEDPHSNRLIAYDVRDLLDDDLTASQFRELIGNLTSAPWWDVSGDGGDVEIALDGCCFVRQFDRGQREVAQLIADLRAARDQLERERAEDRGAAESSETLALRMYSLENATAAASMSRVLIDVASPTSWKGRGGKGTVHVIGNQLLVRQPAVVHREIRNLMSAFEKSRDGSHPDGVLVK
jgi:hypothetical protein